MIPPELHDFFLGNVGASAAFIGLLFVALSIAPETKLHGDEFLRQQSLASNAYVALVNVFFVSAYALIPGRNLGDIGVFMGSVGLLSILLSGISLQRHSKSRSKSVQWLQVFGSLGVYAVELYLAVRLLVNPAQPNMVSALAFLLLPIYAIGLGRAWQLLGERSLKKSSSFTAEPPAMMRRKHNLRMKHNSADEAHPQDVIEKAGNGNQRVKTR